MSLPDLDTEEGRAAYRAEVKAVGRPLRLGGLVLILLGAGYVIATRYEALPAIQPLMLVAYGFVAAGWVLFLAATYLRTRYHKRRLAEGL
ncbi:hypothetical protein [Brevundimonas sp. M20]|uniref:hypothetical protein n=1 Tax=Brevundimonas sp. M20 TaxID=2591463 RepID=UPI0011472A29|nr:hypothetical protein [Brevundimonas sp. M20]QDH73175.1 hypothetical protein FKQ52_06880 [Brevundimonas sp. M20]